MLVMAGGLEVVSSVAGSSQRQLQQQSPSSPPLHRRLAQLPSLSLLSLSLPLLLSLLFQY